MSRSKDSSRWKRSAGKPRWSESDARLVVEAWRESGKPIETFAREHDVPAWRLRWWAPRLEAGGATTSVRSASARPKKRVKVKRSEAEQRLLPVVVSDGRGRAGAALVVRLPDGIEVELRDVAELQPEEVGRLVAALRRSGS